MGMPYPIIYDSNPHSIDEWTKNIILDHEERKKIGRRAKFGRKEKNPFIATEHKKK